jgi:hypothetical protein
VRTVRSAVAPTTRRRLHHDRYQLGASRLSGSVPHFHQTATAMRFETSPARPTGCGGRRFAEPVPSNRVSSASVRRPLPFAASGRYHSRVGAILLRSASWGGKPAASAARDRCCYLPREVFFGRLGFAGAFFTVWASGLERFLPATSDSFPIDLLAGAPYRGSPPCAVGRLPPGQGLRRNRPRRLARDCWAYRRYER